MYARTSNSKQLDLTGCCYYSWAKCEHSSAFQIDYMFADAHTHTHPHTLPGHWKASTFITASMFLAAPPPPPLPQHRSYVVTSPNFMSLADLILEEIQLIRSVSALPILCVYFATLSSPSQATAAPRDSRRSMFEVLCAIHQISFTLNMSTIHQ